MAKSKQEYFEKVSEQAELEIRERSLIRIPVYFVVYLIIAAVTPIGKRYPTAVLYFGVFVTVLFIARMWLSLSWKRFFPEKKKLWKTLFLAGTYVSAFTWGVFCSLSICYFELGWVSFFVILVTCAVVAGEMSALSPKLDVLSIYLVLMLFPSVVTSYLYIQGVSGIAISLFFLVYLVVMLLQGRVQGIQYWQRLSETAKLMAIIDAVPGTLAWISSDLHYLGVNRKMAQVWGLEPSAFVGKKMGFADSKSQLVTFAKSFFESEDTYRTAEIQRTILGRTRQYFTYGQKYSHGTEAILLGIDVTDRKDSEHAVVAERAQRLFSARLANLGQVFQKISGGLLSIFRTFAESGETASLPESTRLLNQRLLKILGVVDHMARINQDESPEEIDTRDLLEDIHFLFAPYTQAHGISLSLNLEKCGKFRVKRGQITEVLVSLLCNAFDILVDCPVKEITLKSEVSDDHRWCRISVIDSGKGIPPELRDRIFEPLFSTKKASQSTGSGLSVSREVIEENGGELYLDKASTQTAFVISLPLSE